MEKKINLGCGKLILEGYTNIDILDFGQEIKGDAKLVMRSEAEARPESLLEVRADHFLEHFTNTEVIEYLNLANKLLKKGGLLKITVPSVHRGNAYILPHKSYYTKETFEDLGVAGNEKYGILAWKVEKVIENERGDIHAWLIKP